MIEISASAQTYLEGLLSKQDDENVSIRIFVAQPGTPQAETCIAYCRPGEEQEGDIAVEYAGFRAWFEGRSEAYLEDAQVDWGWVSRGRILVGVRGCGSVAAAEVAALNLTTHHRYKKTSKS